MLPIAEKVEGYGGRERLRVHTHRARLRRMRLGVIRAGEGLQAQSTRGGRRVNAVMVTLTYKNVEDWRPNHVRDYIRRVRQWAKRQGFPLHFVWVCELQKRGAPHYHIVYWLPKGLMIPKADKRGWWPHGMTNTVRARRPVGYLVKYASKGASKGEELHENEGISYPRGCRIHAAGGLEQDPRMFRRWCLLPGYVRAYWDDYKADIVPCVGGGWVSRTTGEQLASQWWIAAIGDEFIDVEDTTKWNLH